MNIYLRDYAAALEEEHAGTWGKLWRRSTARVGTEHPELNLQLRMWLVAAGRAKPGGHALFKPGELADRLPKLQQATGEVSTFGHRHLRDTMDALVHARLLAPGSTLPPNGPACLVLPPTVYEVHLRRGGRCCPIHPETHVYGA